LRQDVINPRQTGINQGKAATKFFGGTVRSLAIASGRDLDDLLRLFIDFPALHYEDHLFHDGDIGERVAFDGDDVGEFAGL
jgi:hypothetical protein